jgi:hypothetical protein
MKNLASLGTRAIVKDHFNLSNDLHSSFQRRSERRKDANLSTQTKIPIWEYFGGPWNENVDINSGHLDYFTTIGYM